MITLFVLALAGCGVEHKLESGREAIKQRDLPRAERIYRDVLHRQPDLPQALYGLGWTYHLAQQPQQARSFFERCVSVAPDSHLGYKGLGSVALAEDNLVIAEQRFREALQRAPGDIAVLNSLALMFLKSQRYDQALATYEQLLAAEPDNAGVLLGYAETLLRVGRADDALRAVDEGLAARDTNEQRLALLLQLRARLLIAMTAGRIDEERCAETATPVLAYLDEAQAALRRAAALEVENSGMSTVERLLFRRRHAVTRACPLSSLEADSSHR